MTNIDKEFLIHVEDNNLRDVIRLLKFGADVRTNNDFALQCCAKRGYLDMISILLQHGANLHVLNDCPLRWSAHNGHLDVVTKLLEFGANIDAGKDTHFCSALEFSVRGGHLDIMAKLLECGADVHANDDGALQFSATNQHLDIMAKLLESGVNIYSCDNKILEQLKANFNERMADIMLPYCEPHDYKFFPRAYICKKICPTKNANSYRHVQKID